MGFSRQEYSSGFLCPPPGDLPDPGVKHRSPALQANSLPLSHQGSIYICIYPFIVDEHLGYFHILAIVNGAAMNIGVHVSFQIMVFSKLYPGVELLGSFLFLIF